MARQTILAIGVMVLLLAVTQISAPSGVERQALAAVPDFNFGAAGDWAAGTNAKTTANNMNSHGVELAIGLGDYAYTTGTSATDNWYNNIITALKGKFKGALGNHDTGDASEYAKLFGQTGWYYSYNYQNVHFVMIDPNHSYGVGSAQYNFVKSDLASAATNSAITWRVVVFHQPMYTSPTTHSGLTTLRDTYHPLFDQYGVDLVLEGHNHNYQRTYPLKYDSASPSSPTVTTTEKSAYTDPQGEIFIQIGTGGQSPYSLGGTASFTITQFASVFGYLNFDVTNNGLTLKGTYYSNTGTTKDTFSINKSGSTPTNNPPVANAGADETGTEGVMITLDGTASTDPDGNVPLTYKWTQTAGPTVTLSSTTASKPTFTAPQVTSTTSPTALTFSLTVTDSKGLADSTPDSVTVDDMDSSTTTNSPPVSNAGADQTVDEGAVVTLDGTASTDPDGNVPLTYKWTQTAGPTVTLSSTTASKPTFTAPQVTSTTSPTALTFSLTVTDSKGKTDSTPDSVTINVQDSSTTTSPYHYAPYFTLTGTNYRDTTSSNSLKLTKFTVATWFSTTQNVATGTNAILVNKGGLGDDAAGKNMNYGIWLTGTENLRAGFESKTGTDYLVTTTASYNDGKWHYAVLTYDGSKLILYIDGKSVNSMSTTATPDNTGSQPVRDGANSLTLGSYYIGKLDDLRIWNRAITPTEVSNAYSSGTFKNNGQVLYQSFG